MRSFKVYNSPFFLLTLWHNVYNSHNVLSKPNRVGYADSLNLVKESINALIKYAVDHQLSCVPYEEAYQVIDESISTFVTKKGFIDELIAEGILSKNVFWNEGNKHKEEVYFAYERFGDHLTVQYLLGQYPDLEKEFKEGGKLHSYVKDEFALKINKGLIEAFSIQVPERNGCEFFNLIPTFKNKRPVIESFVESLLWRNIDTINEESKKYVNEHVLSYQGTPDYFRETILAVTGIPKHYFNAHFLHNLLMNLSLAERDADWTQFLKYQYSNESSVKRLIDESSVKRLIDWARNQTDKSHISDESVMLCGITLAWFHTSTNRELRDCSTKALVCLLQDRMEVLIKILKMFEGVNDPYVYERLFAVAYGCAVRTEKKEGLTDLSIYIHQTIFKDKDEVYPHVLLRDYARGVIEFTNYSGFELPFDIDEIRPPYKSSFPKAMMTNDEIDKKYKKEHYISQNSILSSMTTEYGRGMCRYGDFGRYTFESALSYWDVDANALSNLAIEWIFEKYGYDVDKHGEYDKNTVSNNRRLPTIERIGKKYQWIAFYEMVARVSDNFKKYKGWKFEKEKEEPYQGPWNPYIRDIDPTMLISKTGNCDDEQRLDFWSVNKENFNWDCSNENWVKQTKGLPSIENILQVKDDKGDEWLVLEGAPSWSEPKKIGKEEWDQPHKNLWCQIKSYIVKDDKFDSFKNWAVKQEFMGHWMPESGDRYEMFSREYYWSPAQDYFITEVQDNESGKYIAEVNVTAQGFLWEEECDRSKEDAIRFLKPSKLIYEGMNLKHSQKEGEFLNISNEVQCFATNVYHDSASYLLIKKVPFLKFLQDNNLNIVWTVLGEKRIIGGQLPRTDYPGRLKINEAYYFDKNGEIMRNLNTKNT